ncbi:MAG: Holliday junction resolvase RuvX [Betaproteobacteria bacterium]|nr:Holliday junction resolvase RuvX [Betaproteobacteria bacterium]
MPEETILAFDFGARRIGVAVGNSVTRTARALTTLHVESNAERLAAVAALVAEWQPARLVVGEPHHADGAPHEVAHLAKKFGNRLREQFRLPVEYEDETLSSAAAAEALDRAGVFGERRRGRLDAEAAQVILQRFLDKWTAHAA